MDLGVFASIIDASTVSLRRVLTRCLRLMTLNAFGFGEGRVFSTMDGALGYWHIPIEDRDKEKTLFTTNSGTYQFNVTPFGLTGAPGAFCRAMNNCLREFLFKCALVFVDDIVVWSPDLDSHKQDLANVFS